MPIFWRIDMDFGYVWSSGFAFGVSFWDTQEQTRFLAFLAFFGFLKRWGWQAPKSFGERGERVWRP